MGWVDDWHGQLVGLDTAPLIYYLEEHPTYLPLVDPFFDALARAICTRPWAQRVGVIDPQDTGYSQPAASRALISSSTGSGSCVGSTPRARRRS